MSADEFVNAAEEQILHHCTYENLNWDKFKRFYENTYKEPCEWEDRDRIFICFLILNFKTTHTLPSIHR